MVVVAQQRAQGGAADHVGIQACGRDQPEPGLVTRRVGFALAEMEHAGLAVAQPRAGDVPELGPDPQGIEAERHVARVALLLAVPVAARLLGADDSLLAK